MKHKAWFRLTMKICGMVMMIIGVAMFGISLCEIVWRLLRWTEYRTYSFSDFVPRDTLYSIPFLCIGAYLCFRGEYVINRAFPTGPKCCPGCGYQVRGNESGICSECGAVLPTEFRVANHD